MGFLDKFTEDHFKVLSDGRTVFLPKGTGGPAYLVPDEATRKRYERLIQVGGWIGSGLLVIAGKFAFRDGTFNWQWAALLLLVPAWSWYIGRHAAERLQEVHDASLFSVPPSQMSEFNAFRSWALAAGALLCLVGGLAISVQHPAAWVRWVGMAIALAAALTIPIALQELQRKRELDARGREGFRWQDNSSSW